jgi:hypothetical protein
VRVAALQGNRKWKRRSIFLQSDVSQSLQQEAKEEISRRGGGGGGGGRREEIL